MKNTNIVMHKQYATYQGCFDIYSSTISNDEVFKKVFLYIIDWLKNRIGIDNVGQISELTKYPLPKEFKQFDESSISSFKLRSQLDIKMFVLEQENCLAIRISEPDNRAEFKNGAMDDAATIRGRSFTTEISLKKNDKNVTLAVLIICVEPIENSRDAIPFRPAFINTLYRDIDIELAESGIDRQFGFLRNISESGRVSGKPIVVDKNNSMDFVKLLLLNSKNQMPIIILPERVNDMKYTSKRYENGETIEYEKDIYLMAYSLMGYAHVVVVADSVLDTLFAFRKSRCEEYGEVLQDNYMIFHQGFESGSGLPDSPMYLSLDTIEDISVKSAVTNKGVNDEILDDEYHGCEALDVAEQQAKKYSVRKNYSFAPAMFYRELKKEYYKYVGESDTAAAVSNLEQEVVEKDALINDLSSKLSMIEKESKKRIDELKSKFEGSQMNFTKYRDMYELTQRKVDAHDAEIASLKDNYEQQIRQKDIMLSVLTGRELPKPSEDIMKAFYRDTPSILIDCGSEYKNPLVRELITCNVTDRLHKIYAGLKEEFRRYQLIEIILQYNVYLAENGYPIDAILYYPKSLELYDGEFRDVIYDAIYEVAGKDGCLNMLLDYNEFDFAQSEKKEEINNKINGYRQHQSIKALLERVGFRCKSSSNHFVYAYYGDERYKITVACTPSDTNSGKNLAERICELCL